MGHLPATPMNTLAKRVKDQAENNIFPGFLAFELWSTHGLPKEVTKDILTEKGWVLEEDSYYIALEIHRKRSCAG